jgi:hypothetical protein
LVITKARYRVLSLLAMVCVVLVAAYVYRYLVATTTGANDISECKATVNSVVSAVHVPESISSPGHPSVFCDREISGLLLRPVEHIRVYGVVDPRDQDALLVAVESMRMKTSYRKVVVEFYEKENWKTWTDTVTGNRGGERGPETPVRRAFIERP